MRRVFEFNVFTNVVEFSCVETEFETVLEFHISKLF